MYCTCVCVRISTHLSVMLHWPVFSDKLPWYWYMYVLNRLKVSALHLHFLHGDRALDMLTWAVAIKCYKKHGLDASLLWACIWLSGMST